MKHTSLLLCAFLGATGLRAAETQSPEAQLRDALRNATLQLRTAEGEKGSLQSEKAALTEEKKALTDKFEALRKQAVAERTADEKTIAGLKAKSATQEAEIAQLKEALQKAEATGQQATALATTKEGDRAKLAADIVVLERQLADREAKNIALFKLGGEILTRYEKFSLGEALAAREPFVGATRAKLENLVQDYQDKLAAQRTKP